MERRSINNADLSFAEVNGLKNKAKKYGRAQVKVGRTKFDLEVPVHVLGEGTVYHFVSIPAMNLVLSGRSKDGAYLLATPDEFPEAVKTLKSIRRTSKTAAKTTAPKMPDELAAILAKVPNGYKLVFADGGYKLAKMRTRSKGNA